MPSRDPARPRAAPAPATAVGRPRRPARTVTEPRLRAVAASKAPAALAPRREEARVAHRRMLRGSGRLAALVLAIVCAGGLVYLLTARTLTVQRLTILGMSATTEQEIAAGSGVVGHNMFTVEPQVVAERLAALPTVREARVWGELPDRLVIYVVEREPIMIWRIGEDRYLIDAGGAVLAVNPPEEWLRDLPVVAVREVASPQVGGRVTASTVANLALILHSAPEQGLPIAALEYSPKDGYVLALDGNRRIILGDGARLPEKLAVSAAIVASEANWTVLNVGDPDRPFFPVR